MSFTPEQVTEILQIYFDNFVNQTYTGMRYVPIIGRRGESSAAWDNSEPYEPLTIVTYNNESYTSRQFVPAAADIADTDYWVKTGAYNAQIVALQDALPIAQFDSENTVKDYVDTLASFIPATDFDNDNTVKAYIDGVADLLPSSAFDSVNTVRGALNEVHEVIDNIGFVTVEMFGAYGDGVHDDTAIIQNVIDNYKNVRFTSNSYAVTTLNLANNGVYDFNGASLISSQTSVLECGNAKKATTSLSAAYVAGQNYIEVSDTSDIEIGDIVTIINNETWSPNRNWYKLGGLFVVEKIDTGKVYINGSMPFAMVTTDSVIDIYESFTCTIKNVTCPNTVNNQIFINMNYSCKNCVIDNFTCFNDVYVGAEIRGYNNIIKNSNMSINTLGYNGNCYCVVLSGTLNKVQNCTLNCVWHGLTTTGEFVTYNSTVVDSTINNFSDHESAYNTYIDNCIFSNSLVLSNAATILNSVIHDGNICPSGENGISNYLIENCVFTGKFGLNNYPQNPISGTMHFDNITFSNCSIIDPSTNYLLIRVYQFNSQNIAFGNINIINCHNFGIDTASSSLKPAIKQLLIQGCDYYKLIQRASTSNIDTIIIRDCDFVCGASSIFTFEAKNLFVENVTFTRPSGNTSSYNTYIYQNQVRVIFRNVFADQRNNFRVDAGATNCTLVKIENTDFYFDSSRIAYIIPLYTTNCDYELTYYNSHIYSRTFDGTGYTFTQWVSSLHLLATPRLCSFFRAFPHFLNVHKTNTNQPKRTQAKDAPAIT